MLRRVITVCSTVVCALAFAGPVFAQDATLTQAKSLVDSKQFQAAFDLLDPLESGRAGDPEFDYLLGVAAIDSGKFTRCLLYTSDAADE